MSILGIISYIYLAIRVVNDLIYIANHVECGKILFTNSCEYPRIMMLKRKMTDAIARWKQHSHKALLLTGARQVGKSFVIRAFGREHYSSYVEINLLLDKDAARTLAGSTSAIDFINRVALLTAEPLVEHDTLIFVDEIQELPEIVTLIKALVEDGRYSYAFSGSMLGTEFKGISSFPVGFVDHFIMRSLDFEEFCWAIGIGQDVLDRVRECVRYGRMVDDYLHEAFSKNFRAHVVAGGMPEVVQNYLDSGFALVETRGLQAQLVRQYATDIGKFAGSRALEVRRIYDQIPVQLEEDPHRFMLSSLRHGAQYGQYDHDFLWLANAGVGLMVQRATEAKSPLKRSEDASKFKLYQSDTGMLVSRYPQSTARAIYLDMKAPNLGGIYENVVAQELAARGIPLWYYQSDAVGEVDFLMEGRSGHVVPIEVKAGKKVRSHAALDRLLAVSGTSIREAVVLSRNNVSKEGPIWYLPWYAVYCLDEFTEREEGTFTFAPVVPE